MSLYSMKAASRGEIKTITSLMVFVLTRETTLCMERNTSDVELKPQQRKAALQALKRKKRYEKQLAQIDGTLSTIEFQREALENAHTNTEVIKNMGFAAKAMKAAHDNMDIDKVDELMQDITEQQELAQEISDAISKPGGFGEEFEEDELLAELEELEQEELDKNLLEIGGTENVQLPNVPATSLPSRPAKKKEEEDEDDMKDLEKWAAN
ncbi:charged multivesicular body protein 4b-like isoform X2 [Xyrauchen texanus]|uniref:charged multivesicular body protein 4b-like isoform X2 n=1 Tax=Xyrauchen texanus TaxID=154827 RepID=UPI002242A40F|nr:charged multivesicular body protein 4b-like isoform X2 [Xyrauchen texanus]XP_051997264.1 charged multivesicular body protein 4b-like isoform X2 [Xyrauchen texanus]XP_051997265.1 charged multivesicular body protein 4b-like isoform X2 [Xyrauchen texanus]